MYILPLQSVLPMNHMSTEKIVKIFYNFFGL